MAIDTSIYSQLNTQPVDPMASVGRVMALKTMMGQQQMQNLQAQQLGLSLSENMRLRDLFAQNPNATPQEVMAASPTVGIGYARAISERALADAKTQQALAATQAQTVKTGRDLLASASSDADYSGWQQYMQAHGWQGDPGMPQSVNDPNFSAWRQQKLMTADQLLDRLKPNYQMTNLGGTSQVVQVNPNAPGAVTGPLQHTMTPGEQASNAMARAHLAVTAATADPFGMLGIKDIAAAAGAPVAGAGAPAGQPAPGGAAPGQRAPVSLAPPPGVTAPKGFQYQPVTAGNWQQTMGTDVHGDDFLKVVPPGLGSQIKAYAEGRLAFPAGFALKSPYFQAMMQMVGQYDPTFDAVNYNARSKMRSSLASTQSGTIGGNLTKINTAIGHLDSFDKAAQSLNNGPLPWVNSIVNNVLPQMGATNLAGRIRTFQQAKEAVSNELMNVFRGTGASSSDTAKWAQTLNQADSPEALKASVVSAVNLLDSRIAAIRQTYQNGMGTTEDPLQMVYPKAAATLERLRGGAGPTEVSGSIKTAPVAAVETDSLPDPAKFAGRMMTDNQTNTKYRSNGRAWVRQ